MSFSVDIDRFITQANTRQNNFVRVIVMDVDRTIHRKSPVGNPELWKHPESAPPGYVGGTFRSNWQLGVNNKPLGTLARSEAGIGRLIAAHASQIPQQAAGNVYYLVNNLPYAQALEDGHSSQARPGYLVADTAVDFQALIDRAVLEL